MIYLKDFLKWVLFKLYSLRPIESNKIVCNNFLGKGYGDNPKYIVEELLRRNKKYQIVWYCDKKYNFSVPNKVRCVNSTKEFIKEMATAKIWISNVRLPIYMSKRKKQYYIQTWHGGMATKMVEKDVMHSLTKYYVRMAKKDGSRTDIMISNCKLLTKIYYKSFWFNGDICEYGTPRNDNIINFPNEYRKKVYKYYNLDKDINILLYAPTFRSNNTREVYNLDISKIVNALNKKTNKKWIGMVRLHPNISNPEKYFNFNKNIINACDYPDMNELLSAVSMLISDYSSSVYDFFLLNRPVLIYANDMESYMKERNFYIKPSEGPFPIFNNNKDLINYISQKGNYCDIDAYKKFINENGIIETGKASNAICDIIEKQIYK